MSGGSGRDEGGGGRRGGTVDGDAARVVEARVRPEAVAVAGGAAARHARHHALRRDPPDAVVAAVGHEEHAVRVEHQPARVRERRLDALAVGGAARARPGEHAQAVAVEDADAVVAGVGDVHAPRRRDGEPARVEQRDATTLGCVFMDGLGDGGAVPSRMEMSSEQSIRRVLRRVGGRVSAGAGAFGRNGESGEPVESMNLTGGKFVDLGCIKPKRCERVAGIPAERRNARRRPPPPARVGAYASLAFCRGGRRPSLHSPPPLAVVLLPVVGSPHRSRIVPSFGPNQGVAR